MPGNKPECKCAAGCENPSGLQGSPVHFSSRCEPTTCRQTPADCSDPSSRRPHTSSRPIPATADSPTAACPSHNGNNLRSAFQNVFSCLQLNRVSTWSHQTTKYISTREKLWWSQPSVLILQPTDTEFVKQTTEPMLTPSCALHHQSHLCP